MKLCIYHGGCTDGVAAAWAVWAASAADTFHPGIYQQDPPWAEFEAADSVVIVDFSYKRLVMEEIAARAHSVLVLDHHKTAQDDLAPLLESGVLAGEFDMTRCGAMMAFDHFHQAERPELLKAIDAADRFTPDRDAALILALRSYPHTPEAAGGWEPLFIGWDDLMRNPEKLAQDGTAIHRYYRQRVDETKAHASRIRLGDFAGVPVVNAPYYLASDVAGELAATAPDGIACVWWCNATGSVTLSVRSSGDVDVGELCAKFGGGGHPGAAGFRIDGLADLLLMMEP